MYDKQTSIIPLGGAATGGGGAAAASIAGLHVAAAVIGAIMVFLALVALGRIGYKSWAARTTH